VLGFSNSFHGVTLGALLVSDSRLSRMDSTSPVSGGAPLPYNAHSGGYPDLRMVERRFDVSAVGQERPAAVIVETVQGEGGVNVASVQWLQALSRLCSDFGILLIVDDVQAGCGRTGSFFSFETAGIVPDIVCVSKSIGGYGLPLALTLIRPDLDVWEPGEHSGTFRGNNHAFITATKAIETYWSDDVLEKQTLSKGESVRQQLACLAAAYPQLSLGVRGAGLINGLSFLDGKQASSVCFAAFERGLLVETAGRQGEVVKLMPPLTTTDDELDTGIELLKASIEASVR
jgi:diaminobutyrate-2-oxoglutarate transaminase